MVQQSQVQFLLWKGVRKFWQTFLYGLWKTIKPFYARKKLPEQIHHILFLPVGGIGNFILFTPLIAVLRNKYPTAQFYVIIRSRGAADVLRGYPNCTILEFDFNDMHSVRHFVRNHPLPRIDLAFNCETFYGAYLAYRYKTRFLISFTYSFGVTAQSDFLCYRACDIDHSKHEVLQYHDLYTSLYPDEKDVIHKPFLHIRPEDKNYADNILEKHHSPIRIGMHIGTLSNMPEKRWSTLKFAQLASRLHQDLHASIIIVGGDDEKEIVSVFQETISPQMDVVNLVGKSTLKQTATVIQKCDLFISNDSGPMHIAAAVGTPTVAIFGPTNPTKNKPWGDNDQFVVVRQDLPCSPCYQAYSSRITCTNPNFLECMERISVEDVYREACGVLLRLQNNPIILNDHLIKSNNTVI